MEYYGRNELKNSFFLLKEKGITKFFDYYLIFYNNSDLTSPIFDQYNKEIGYAYKYVPNINDYSSYIINNNYKIILKLYFNYNQFSCKSINKNNGNSYLLINGEFFKKYKDYYEYQALENLLSNNNFAQQAVKNIKEKQNYIINDKIITLIIKSLPNNINKKFIEKSKNKVQFGNILKEPNLKGIPNTDLFYYDEFVLIDKELYSLIFKGNNIDIYGKCYFVNGYICIKMLKQQSQIKATQIYIFGHLNLNHIFIASHLLEYNSVNDFLNNFNFANETGGFDKYINSFEFKNNYIEELTDINNKSIGLIYNLNINNKNNNSIEAIDIKRIFSNPPLIGLKKIKFIPSMNATLQCFCQIEKIINYFRYNKNLEQIINKNHLNNKTNLVKSFKDLIENLWPSNHLNSIKIYNPFDLQNKLMSMNNIFKSAETNECKDLIEFIIINLHEELNKRNKNNNNINQNNIKLDKSNQSLVLNIFVQNFMNNNDSIISDLFFWTNQSIIQCMNCGIQSFEYQTNSMLIFQIEEIYKHKNNLNLMNMNMSLIGMNQKSITIFDCFDYYQKIETLSGEDAILCDNCKNISISQYRSCIYTSPEIFILIINKSKNSDIKLQFCEELNLSNYIFVNKYGFLYRLFGVISRINGNEDHFIAYVKNPINCLWYKYDDECVYPVNNFRNEILESTNPYVLFYQKIAFN